MEENYQNKADNKLIATEDVRWAFNKKSKLFWVPKCKKLSDFTLDAIMDMQKGVTTMATVDNSKVSSALGKGADQKETGCLNRPRKGGRSIWDWLDLASKLAIPLMVACATIGFGWWQAHLTDVQHTNDQQAARDQQQATTLQTYIGNIQDLLIKDNLLKSSSTNRENQYYHVGIVARARTLAALRELDSGRKVRLLTFLYEANLIGFVVRYTEPQTPIIDLKGADLSGVAMSGVAMSGVNLSGANLSGANLSEDTFFFADLSGADLSHTNLSNADFWAANLVTNKLTQQQLEVLSTSW